MLSAGGHYATNAYKALGLFGADDDIGLALPTTVMPTGFFLSRNDLIRFEGSNDDTKRSNMCVAPTFACGINPMPMALSAWPTMKQSGCVEEHAPWTFINFTSACRNDTSPWGFYAALYQRDDINIDGERFHTGFVEVFDTAVNPRVTFAEFWQGPRGVLARNKGRTFNSFGIGNVYVTTTGQEITFELAPDSRILKIANRPSPAQSTKDMATGTILEGGNGGIDIYNPYTGETLSMDVHDPLNPVQGSGGVEFTNMHAHDRCELGFVWRKANPSDHICVTAEQQRETQSENTLANTRRSPTGGPLGPDTCAQGFIWRDAFPNDHVCVPPSSRSQAEWDNKLAPSRYLFPVGW